MSTPSNSRGPTARDNQNEIVEPRADSLASRSAAAAGWSWGGACVRAGTQLIVQIALARLLGPEAFGQAAAVLLVVAAGWLVAEGGFGAALVQRAEVRDDDIAQALGWILMLSATVALVMLALADRIAAALGDRALAPLVVACAGIIPLQALANLPISLMQRQFEFARLQVIQIGGYLIAYAVIGVILASLGWGAWSILVAYATHVALMLVVGWLWMGLRVRPRLSGDRSVRSFGLRITGANLINWALESFDRALVSRWWGSAALGQYAVAANLARAPITMLVGPVQPVAFATAARLQFEQERVARGYLAALDLAILVTSPLFVYLAFHSAAIIDLLYGPRWSGAAPLFALFSLSAPLLAVVAITGPLLRGLGAVGSELRAHSAALVLLIVAMWLIAERPVVAAAFVVVMVTALRAVVLYRLLAARLRLPRWAWLQASRCGSMFTAVVVAVSVLVHGQEGATSALLSAFLSLFLCLLLLRLTRGMLIGADLTQTLLDRCDGSRVAAAVCAFARLRVSPDS